jgi:hypothetical protein
MCAAPLPQEGLLPFRKVQLAVIYQPKAASRARPFVLFTGKFRPTGDLCQVLGQTVCFECTPKGI